MPQLLAYFNGRFLPASQLSIAVCDAGFVQGVTVSEQLRTFRGRLFRLRQHLDRLRRSLEIVGVEPGVDLPRLGEAASQLAANNHRLLAERDDLGLSLFVTPGAYPTFAPPGGSPPTVAMHTYPLPFHLWWAKYQRGQKLAVTDIRQVPSASWPAELKCRSRMHYYLADREAHLADPGARALLLDQEGKVVEASTANVILYRRREGFISPPRERILPGVSIAVLAELARDSGVPFLHRDVTVDDVVGADEVILSSTAPCLLPVVSLNGRPIGSGKPGDAFRRALSAWSDLVGLNIERQAEEFRHRAAG
jgi:branched-subunit amino acid aminotransferase/4-amino-4-deoxychorismate lyase